MTKKKHDATGTAATKLDGTDGSTRGAEAHSIGLEFAKSLTDDVLISSLMVFGMSEVEATETVAHRL